MTTVPCLEKLSFGLSSDGDQQQGRSSRHDDAGSQRWKDAALAGRNHFSSAT